MFNLKLPFRDIMTAGGETLNAFYKSYNEYERISKFHKARVIFWEKSGLVRGLDRPLYGDLNTDKNFFRIRGLNAVYPVAGLGFSSELHEYVVLIPELFYETLDFEKLAEYQHIELLNKERKITTEKEANDSLLEFSRIKAFCEWAPKLSVNHCFNMVKFQTQQAKDFSAHSESVAVSNAYKLLYTTPNRILILVGMAALFAGVAIGALTMGILYFILVVVRGG
jgi:hypothetical protein